jgi:hypothetical protein
MDSYNAINGTPAVANTYTLNQLARDGRLPGICTSGCGGVDDLPATSGRLGTGPWVVGGPANKPIWANLSTGQQVSAAAGGQAMSCARARSNCGGDEMTATLWARPSAQVCSSGRARARW